MNKYSIQHRVRTVLQFWDDGYEYDGFQFQQWAFSLAKGPHGNSWLVSKNVEGTDVYDAINAFRGELFPILSMMCFIGQCEMKYNWDSILAYRNNNNPNKTFYFRYSQEVPGVPLHFGGEEKRTMNKAAAYGKSVVFDYLQDANNTSNYVSRLSLLIMALEAMAGESSPEKTNKEYIRNEILQDDNLYEEIFKFGTGYRNRLFHGKRILLGSDLCSKIYCCILKYFNRKHGFEINVNVIGAPRYENGDYRIWENFYHLVDDQTNLNLKLIVELLEKRQDLYSVGDSKDTQLKRSKTFKGY